MDLLSLVEKYNTDKESVHGYISHYYSDTLKNYKDKINLLVEIGVSRGESLEMWSKYFEQARIIGVDVADQGYVPSTKNIEFRLGKSQKKETFNDLDNIDIVIDDGSHKLEHQLKTFDILFPKLCEKGVYVIEDVEDIDHSEKFFKTLGKCRILDFREKTGKTDSVIVEIKK